MLKKLVVPAFLVAASSAPAFAEVWTVTEGTGAPARGAWQMTVTGGNVSGSADMVNPRGQKVSFKVSGAVKGNTYTLQRVSPSDGSMCMYRGEMKEPGKISGSAMCGPSSTAWTVTRQ